MPAATDVDGTIASYALVSDVAKGDLTFNSDGTYSFDPNGEFEALSTGDSEQVTFTYRAVDNDGGQSAAKTVTITVNGVDDERRAGRDRRQREHRRGHASSPARCRRRPTATGRSRATRWSRTWPRATLTFNSDGTYSFDPNGEFEALGTGDSEQVTFTYSAVDNDGGQSAAKTVTITVNGVNDAPVATDGSKSTGEDSVLQSSVPTATDIDGTIASYALVSDVAKGEPDLQQRRHLQLRPERRRSKASSTGDSEQVTFTYRAIDNDGGQSAAKTVTITVNGADEAGGGGAAPPTTCRRSPRPAPSRWRRTPPRSARSPRATATTPRSIPSPAAPTPSSSRSTPPPARSPSRRRPTSRSPATPTATTPTR